MSNELELERYRKKLGILITELKKEQDASLRALKDEPRDTDVAVIGSSAMKMHSILYRMLKLAKSLAKKRGLDEKELEALSEELEVTSKNLRKSLASQQPIACFFISEFQFLQRKIIDYVLSVCAPKPLYSETLNLQQELIKKAEKILPINEDWIICVSALMLVEAVVNKKLEELGESIKGSFKERYERLVDVVRQKEKRELPRLLPRLIYEGLRHLAAHGGHKFQPTPDEAKSIVGNIILVISEISGK